MRRRLRGGDFWKSIRDWGVDKRLLSVKERDVLDLASRIPDTVPSERQSKVAMEALNKLYMEGCQIGRDLT